MPTNAASSLAQTERKRLLAHLAKLGDADPGQRAAAALAATRMLQRKGLDWAAMVEVGFGGAGAVAVHRRKA